MKILVTGSNGFIGKRLAVALAQKGHAVFGFDRQNNQNILDFEQVKKAIQGMDVVYHLAASIHEDDLALFETNVHGTKNVLEASAKSALKQFIFLSTVGTMGNIQNTATENTPFSPQTPYEKSKAQAEELTLSYQEVLPVTIVRSALVLGPNEDGKQIIKMVEKNFPLIGNGKNFWQIVFVNDLVDALVFLLNNDNAIGETFIVAEEKPKTLLELVKIIRNEIGLDTNVKTMPVFLGIILAHVLTIYSKITKKPTLFLPEHVQRLVRQRHYSIEKIKSLGWRPKYSTEQGIKETIQQLKVE